MSKIGPENLEFLDKIKNPRRRNRRRNKRRKKPAEEKTTMRE